MEAKYISCSIDWQAALLVDRLYILFIYAMGFCLPTTVLCYSYIRIFFTLRRVSFSCRKNLLQTRKSR